MIYALTTITVSKKIIKLNYNAFRLIFFKYPLKRSQLESTRRNGLIIFKDAIKSVFLIFTAVYIRV
jgi:hypothetical protein